jgi:anti-sigma regulatory factor (Ser/Thr protein kinase)
MFQLDLTNDDHAAAVAQAAALAAATYLGLAEDKRTRLELAAEEVVVNAVKHAYPQGERGKIRVSAWHRGSTFSVMVEDWGLPYDVAEISRYSVDDPELLGLGLHLAWNVCDEAVFRNRGRDGKAFELRFKLPAARPLGLPAEPPPAPEAQGKPMHFVVRRFESSDALEVTRCVWSTYGFTKPDNHLYDPDELVRLNDTGEMVSIVSVAADGTVHGHASLDFSVNAQVPEFTDLVIAPAARRNPMLLLRMLEFGRQFATARNCLGCQAVAVAAHTISQRGALRFGGVPVGVGLASISAEWTLTDEDTSDGARRSEIVIYTPLGRGPDRALFCPERHSEVVRGMYLALDEPVRFRSEQEGSIPDIATELSIESGLLAWGHIVIDVRRLGRDGVAVIAGFLRRFCIDGAAVVELQIRLADPAAALLVDGFERLGFSFSGILPNAGPDGRDDLLILQYLNNVVPDLSGDKVVAACRHIYDYVVAERERVDVALFGATVSGDRLRSTV